MGAIYRREIGAFFTSSIAYVFLAVFYVITGFFFTMDNLPSLATGKTTREHIELSYRALNDPHWQVFFD